MKRSRKAQITGLPFQFIFSLIIIAITLFVAIWAIRIFLARSEQAKIGNFVTEVKNEINELWFSSYEAEKNVSFDFSNKFTYVCFANTSEDFLCNSNLNKDDVEQYIAREGINLFLVPPEKALDYDMSAAYYISCDGKECVMLERACVCFPVIDGKVKIGFVKDETTNGKVLIKG